MPFVEEDPGDDGYVIKSATYENRKVILIGGSNEIGVLYGVYEFLQLYGIRFYSTGDVLPDNPNPFSLPVLDFREKPYFKIRGLNNFLNMDVIDYTRKLPADYPFKEPYMDYGFVQWNDYARFFDQMAKLRFNYIHFGLNHIYLPAHDFIPQYWHFEYNGFGTSEGDAPRSTSVLRQAMAYAKNEDLRSPSALILQNKRSARDTGQFWCVERKRYPRLARRDRSSASRDGKDEGQMVKGNLPGCGLSLCVVGGIARSVR